MTKTFSEELLKRVDLAQIIEPEDWLGMKLVNNFGIDEAHRVVFDSKLSATSLFHLLGKEQISDRSQIFDTTSQRWLNRRAKLRTNRILDVTESYGFQILTPDHDHWPQQLGLLDNLQPLLLWCKGRTEILSEPQIAIVGARACTQYGEAVTEELAAGLSRAGYHITSGGAYGIDAAAHHTVLREFDESYEKSSTIAVLAGGIDRLYPAGNKEMLLNIQKSGVVVSEVVLGRPPSRHRFLSRNRIIAALSEMVIVTEAQHRSGALNTAHHALNIGIPVSAVPGNIYSASSAGCHRLIKEESAQLVTSSKDVLIQVKSEVQEKPHEASLDLTSLLVLDCLPVVKPIPIDGIMDRTGLNAQQVLSILTRLAAGGYVVEKQQLWRSLGRTSKG